MTDSDTRPRILNTPDRTVMSVGMFNEQLCTRCGTCGGACPQKAIGFNERRFPTLLPDRCDGCGLCKEVCPGDQVSYKELTRLTFGHDAGMTSFDGHVLKTFVGHCTENAIRSRAAGGGIITGLMWDLLRTGEVDGCIVTRMNRERPWEGEYFIARTLEELLESQGSKYTIIPVNQVFQEVRELPGKFAYAALPCMVHGFRKLAAKDPVLASKIHVVIGLFCGGALEPYLVPEMLRTKGLDPDDIQDFQFRGGEWPGRFRAILKTGEIRDMHNYDYNDGAYNYIIQLYAPVRCQTCLDGSGQFADIAVSDAWTRNLDGEYRYKNQSRMLVRTPKGLEILKAAVSRGVIHAEDVTQDPDYKTHRMQTRRKGSGAPLRIARWKQRGIEVPEYDVEFEPFTSRERMNERVSAFFLWCGRHRCLRYPMLKFLTSKASKPLLGLRRILKKRKYARLKKQQARTKEASS